MTKLAETEDNNQIPKWLKSAGYVALIVLVIISGYLTLKAELPHIESYFNPFYVRKDVGTATSTSTPSSPRPTVQNLLTSVNEVRAKAGVPPLVIDERLNKSAQTKADDMKARNYFGHVSPDGVRGNDIAHGNMPECVALNENITDSGTPEYNTLEAGMKAWVDSPGHYKQMIKPEYSRTGFGITSTGLVQHFCQL